MHDCKRNLVLESSPNMSSPAPESSRAQKMVARSSSSSIVAARSTAPLSQPGRRDAQPVYHSEKQPSRNSYSRAPFRNIVSYTDRLRDRFTKFRGRDEVIIDRSEKLRPPLRSERSHSRTDRNGTTLGHRQRRKVRKKNRIRRQKSLVTEKDLILVQNKSHYQEYIYHNFEAVLLYINYLLSVLIRSLLACGLNRCGKRRSKEGSTDFCTTSASNLSPTARTTRRRRYGTVHVDHAAGYFERSKKQERRLPQRPDRSEPDLRYYHPVRKRRRKKKIEDFYRSRSNFSRDEQILRTRQNNNVTGTSQQPAGSPNRRKACERSLQTDSTRILSSMHFVENVVVPDGGHEELQVPSRRKNITPLRDGGTAGQANRRTEGKNKARSLFSLSPAAMTMRRPSLESEDERWRSGHAAQGVNWLTEGGLSTLRMNKGSSEASLTPIAPTRSRQTPTVDTSSFTPPSQIPENDLNWSFADGNFTSQRSVRVQVPVPRCRTPPPRRPVRQNTNYSELGNNFTMPAQVASTPCPGNHNFVRENTSECYAYDGQHQLRNQRQDDYGSRKARIFFDYTGMEPSGPPPPFFVYYSPPYRPLELLQLTKIRPWRQQRVGRLSPCALVHRHRKAVRRRRKIRY